jgi:ASC-1-like (ASCH) protein
LMPFSSIILVALTVARSLPSSVAFTFSTIQRSPICLPRKKLTILNGVTSLEGKKNSDDDEEKKYLKRINDGKKKRRQSKTLDAISKQKIKDDDDINLTEKKLKAEAKKNSAFAFLEEVLGSNANDPVVADAVASAVEQSQTGPAYYGDPNVSAKTQTISKASSMTPPSVTRSISKPKKEKSLLSKLDSVKASIVGLFAGGIAVTPVAALHDILLPGDTIDNGIAQWEFDTDMGSLAAALFAVVYRFSVRDGEEKNKMFPAFIVGAFVVVRTVSRVRVSYYCDAVPLDCGDPLGYFDWDMLMQLVWSGFESVALFGATAIAIDYCYEKGYISRID